MITVISTYLGILCIGLFFLQCARIANRSTYEAASRREGRRWAVATLAAAIVFILIAVVYR